jgi:hypothetical protein
MRQWEKEKAVLYSVEVPPHIRHHVATMASKHIVINLREINRNNTHSAVASVLIYFLVSSL